MMVIKKNIKSCEYNIDSGCVEVIYTDNTIFAIRCETIEEKLITTLHSESRLERLMYENPFEYMEMALNGELQEYCNSCNQVVRSQSETMLKDLLEQGYDIQTAESIIREIHMYDS